MLLKPKHIIKYAKNSMNIPISQIGPYITNTEDLRVIPTIGVDMYADLKLLYSTYVDNWDATYSYNANDVITIENNIYIEVYKALLPNINSNPIGNPATWQLSELGVLFENYIVPFASLATMRNFLVWHGINFTQFGVRISDESTSIPIDNDTRGRLIDHVKTHEMSYLNKLRKYLAKKNFTFDSVKYTLPCDEFKKMPKIRVSKL